MTREEWRWVAVVILALMIASTVPYLVAWAAAPEGAHFTGLIFNPQDGNSYIAKMRQGLAGSWVFRLPYTPEPQDGAPVFLFYLFLGHVARWTGLPLIAIYHAARLLGGAAMLAMLYVLASRVSDDVGGRRAMFLLAALGSGLGWLVAFFGYQSADLWVPEAFPVYALLANAHFSLSIGLMTWIADCGLRIGDWQLAISNGRYWLLRLGMISAAVVLGAVQPFGLVAVFGGLGVMLIARAVRERSVPWRAVGWVALAGLAALPYPLYMLQAMKADPALSVWNAQNLTGSPPLWDWALSYGLVLVLAVLGAVFAARRGSNGDWLLMGWALVILVGMYLPLSLQRRLSLGLGVPLGLLAGVGWWRVVRLHIKARWRGLVQGLVVAFCVLTPILLVVGHLAVVSDAYLSPGEWAALAWLRDEGKPDVVVLCSTRMGIFVPAWAGQPVVYGHPFETVNAEERRAQVEAFWAGEMSAEERQMFLRENRVGYILVGTEIGDWRLEIGDLALEADGVKIYDVRSE
ncbi:MAG: hypothetical protein JXA14_07085 [Anaerolineae bacterium]|nr:hypothetical protein [Anaerolineae bacterium]